MPEYMENQVTIPTDPLTQKTDRKVTLLSWMIPFMSQGLWSVPLIIYFFIHGQQLGEGALVLIFIIPLSVLQIIISIGIGIGISHRDNIARIMAIVFSILAIPYAFINSINYLSLPNGMTILIGIVALQLIGKIFIVFSLGTNKELIKRFTAVEFKPKNKLL